MNGGPVPMLGGHGCRGGLQNAGVEKALAPLPTRQSGFTLIEVMVALMVLVLGVLGAAAMTLSALRDGKQSALRSQASALGYELAEVIRTAGPLNETIFTTNSAQSVPTCWTGTGCTVPDMAKNDLNEWNIKVAAQLPNGVGKVCHDSGTNLTVYAACDNLPTSPLVVKLQWDEKNNATSQTALGSQNFTSPVTTRVLSIPITVNY